MKGGPGGGGRRAVREMVGKKEVNRDGREGERGESGVRKEEEEGEEKVY